MSAPTTEAPRAGEFFAARDTANGDVIAEFKMMGNVISPGLIDTDMGAKLVKATSLGGTIATAEAQSPFGRVCKPVDVARLVVFLAGPGGGYISGQRVFVDGGGPAPAMY